MATNGTSEYESEGRRLKSGINHDKVAEVIAKLNALISAMIFVHSSCDSTDSVPEGVKVLSDDAGTLLNHYLLEVVDATKETAPNLIQILLELMEQLQQREDSFYAGFFFALADLLHVKFELEVLGKKIERQEFERCLKQTVEKYRLEQHEQSKEEPNRKTLHTSYVA
jgi:hypothetical protein